MGRPSTIIKLKKPKTAPVIDEDIPVEELTHIQTHPDLDIEKSLSLLRYPPPEEPFSAQIISPILNPWLGIFDSYLSSGVGPPAAELPALVSHSRAVPIANIKHLNLPKQDRPPVASKSSRPSSPSDYFHYKGIRSKY